MAKGKMKNRADLEWENRVLCSDESCIGVIGPDRRCKECGREYEGDLPNRFKDLSLDPDDEETLDTDTVADAFDLEADEVSDNADEDDGVTDEEWASRILCSDESCIGVVGPDGKCKDCGKPYEE